MCNTFQPQHKQYSLAWEDRKLLVMGRQQPPLVLGSSLENSKLQSLLDPPASPQAALCPITSSLPGGQAEQYKALFFQRNFGGIRPSASLTVKHLCQCCSGALETSKRSKYPNIAGVQGPDPTHSR